MNRRKTFNVFIVITVAVISFCWTSLNGAARELHALTVTNSITVHDLEKDSVPLLLLTTEPDGKGEVGLNVRWSKDTSGWFPTWTLELASDVGLLPIRSEGVHRMDGGAVTVLKTETPFVDHTYEATMSYSALDSALALEIVDVTGDKTIYIDGFRMPEYGGPLYLAAGKTTAGYVPLATMWSTGIVQEDGAFLKVDRFLTRDEQAVLRIETPSIAPGLFRVYADDGKSQRVLDDVQAEGDVTIVPVSLTNFPIGSSTIAVDYVEGDDVVLSDRQTIRIGRIGAWLDRLQPEADERIVHTHVVLTSEEALDEPVDVDVTASLYELVWDADRRKYSKVFSEEQKLVNQSIQFVEDAVRIPVRLAMPPKEGNWEVELHVTVDPDVGVPRSNVRYFSTYPPADIKKGDAYTIVVLPDTQIFSQHYPKIYTRMTDWITQQARSMNIAAVLHVGDITNNDTPDEWINAHNSMSLLHGVVPYALTLGNHDMKAGGKYTRRGVSLINDYFTVDEAKQYSGLVDTMTFGGPLENHYHTFSIADTKYLVIALEFGPPDEAVAWANDIVRRHPDHRFILLTHSYTSRMGRRSPDAGDVQTYPFPGDDTTVNTGPDLWGKLVRRHANSFMVISGHLSVPFTIPFNRPRARAGQYVYEMLFDYQREGTGGAGWLGLMTFYPDGTIDVRTFSPYVNKMGQSEDEHGFTSYVRIDTRRGAIKAIRPEDDPMLVER